MRPSSNSQDTYLSDHLADRADLVEALLDADGHLNCQLLVQFVPFSLLLAFGALCLLLLWDILQQRAVADDSALVVDNVTIIINLLSGAGGRVTRGELADDVAILVNDISLAVDLAATHW